MLLFFRAKVNKQFSGYLPIPVCLQRLVRPPKPVTNMYNEPGCDEAPPLKHLLDEDQREIILASRSAGVPAVAGRHVHENKTAATHQLQRWHGFSQTNI